MDRGATTLFYLCGNCKAVNLLPGPYEDGLDFATTICCNECESKMNKDEMQKLRWYSKATRPQP